MAPKVKAKIVKDVTQLVLARRTRMCNFLEYKGVLLLSFVLYVLCDPWLDRFQGCIPKIRISFFRLWDWAFRQRTGDIGDHPSICGGVGSVLRERKSFYSSDFSNYGFTYT